MQYTAFVAAAAFGTPALANGIFPEGQCLAHSYYFFTEYAKRTADACWPQETELRAALSKRSSELQKYIVEYAPMTLEELDSSLTYHGIERAEDCENAKLEGFQKYVNSWEVRLPSEEEEIRKLLEIKKTNFWNACLD